MLRRTLAALALVPLVACSSSGTKDTAAPGPTEAGPSTLPAQQSAGPSASTSAVPTASAAAASARPTPSGTSSARSSTHGGTTGAATAPTGTPAGSYTYDSSGTQSFGGKVDGTSTLTVGALSGDRQSSTLHNSQGDTTQQLVVRSTGSYLSSLAISSPTLSKEFRFSPPALLLPDPARPGARWSWRATSTDGTTTVTASNEVLRTETLTIGGERVPTVVLQTHLVITGDSLSYTADATNWVAPAYRLPVKTHTTGNGQYGTFPAFTFDVTDVLRSVHPG